MKPIELTCPKCQAELKLDSGFAGGVCRCSHCNTLMTVPADSHSERAEQLVRPNAPGARPELPREPKRRRSEPAESPDASSESQTYTTASGRTVEINSADTIPTALRRRLGVRIVTAAIVLGLLAAVLAFGALAVVRLLPPEAPEPTSPALPQIEAFEYDPGANPFRLDRPNVLGMSLQLRTTVLVDASAASEGWLESVNHALRTGLTQPAQGAAVGLIYANAQGVESYNNGLTPLPELSAEAIQEWQLATEPVGELELANGAERARDQAPDKLVLITSSDLSPSQVEAIEGALADSGITVSAISIGRDLPELEGLTYRFGGEYRYLAPDELRRWAAVSPQ